MLQRRRVEADLAQRDVDVAVAVGAVLDLATLELGHGAGDVLGHGAGLRVRHQTSRAEGPPEATDERHHVGRGDGHVEVELARLDLRREVVGADDVGSRLAGLGGGLAGGEHGDAHVLARARRQGDGATHHLVGLAGIDPEAHRHVDALVEPALGGVLDDPERLGRRVELVAVEALQGVGVLLAGHLRVSLVVSARRARSSRSKRWWIVMMVLSDRAAPARMPTCRREGFVPTSERRSRGRQPTTSMPMLRAVPRTCCLAASRS